MQVITTDNLADFLRQRGWLPSGIPARVQLLTGGVSNAVFRVEPEQGGHFVVKQSRPQLRTAAEWFSRPERIFREIDCLRRICGQLPNGAVPGVLFEDRPNFTFAMEAVPANHQVWKSDLLAGRCDRLVATVAATMLATIHKQNLAADLSDSWRDKTFFEELRIDPYYRTVARVLPSLRSHLDELTKRTLATNTCLVLADFSPKNMLLSDWGVSLVDFETAHCGDPAFDLGFFLTHLLLKTLKHRSRPEPFLDLVQAFWTTYRDQAADRVLGEERHIANHLAACLLSRVVGKSTVEYLNPSEQEFVRAWASALLMRPPSELAQVFKDFEQAIEEPSGCSPTAYP